MTLRAGLILFLVFLIKGCTFFFQSKNSNTSDKFLLSQNNSAIVSKTSSPPAIEESPRQKSLLIDELSEIYIRFQALMSKIETVENMTVSKKSETSHAITVLLSQIVAFVDKIPKEGTLSETSESKQVGSFTRNIYSVLVDTNVLLKSKNETQDAVLQLRIKETMEKINELRPMLNFENLSNIKDSE